MKKGETFVGLDQLIEFIEMSNRGFGARGCLYLNYGERIDPKQNEKKPYGIVRCKYTGCNYQLNLNVSLNEQNE